MCVKHVMSSHGLLLGTLLQVSVVLFPVINCNSLDGWHSKRVISKCISYGSCKHSGSCEHCCDKRISWTRRWADALDKKDAELALSIVESVKPQSSDYEGLAQAISARRLPFFLELCEHRGNDSRLSDILLLSRNISLADSVVAAMHSYWTVSQSRGDQLITVRSIIDTCAKYFQGFGRDGINLWIEVTSRYDGVTRMLHYGLICSVYETDIINGVVLSILRCGEKRTVDSAIDMLYLFPSRSVALNDELISLLKSNKESRFRTQINWVLVKYGDIDAACAILCEKEALDDFRHRRLLWDSLIAYYGNASLDIALAIAEKTEDDSSALCWMSRAIGREIASIDDFRSWVMQFRDYAFIEPNYCRTFVVDEEAMAHETSTQSFRVTKPWSFPSVGYGSPTYHAGAFYAWEEHKRKYPDWEGFRVYYDDWVSYQAAVRDKSKK